MPETTYHAILGQILRELRKGKGISQFDIAKKIKINRSSWSRIENGTLAVNVHQLQKISKVLGMEVDEILNKVQTIAQSMEEKGYAVHYDSIKEINAKSSGAAGKGLALIGGTVLGLLVGSVLFGGSDETEDDKKSE